MNFCTFGFLPRVFFMLEMAKPRDAHSDDQRTSEFETVWFALRSDNINWEIRQPATHNKY